MIKTIEYQDRRLVDIKNLRDSLLVANRAHAVCITNQDKLVKKLEAEVKKLKKENGELKAVANRADGAPNCGASKITSMEPRRSGGNMPKGSLSKNSQDSMQVDSDQKAKPCPDFDNIGFYNIDPVFEKLWKQKKHNERTKFVWDLTKKANNIGQHRSQSTSRSDALSSTELSDCRGLGNDVVSGLRRDGMKFAIKTIKDLKEKAKTPAKPKLVTSEETRLRVTLVAKEQEMRQLKFEVEDKKNLSDDLLQKLALSEEMCVEKENLLKKLKSEMVYKNSQLAQRDGMLENLRLAAQAAGNPASGEAERGQDKMVEEKSSASLFGSMFDETVATPTVVSSATLAIKVH